MPLGMEEDHKIQSLMGYTRSGSGGNTQVPPMAAILQPLSDETLRIIHSPLVEGPRRESRDTWEVFGS